MPNVMIPLNVNFQRLVPMYFQNSAIDKIETANNSPELSKNSLELSNNSLERSNSPERETHFSQVDTEQAHRHSFKAKLMAAFTLVFACLFLSACVSPPAIDGETFTARQLDSELIEIQEQSLAQLSEFGLLGSVAFFDDAEGIRDAARFNWNKTEQETHFRLYHQIGGTLARLQQTDELSVLIDRSGNRYEGSDLNLLLLQHTGMAIPFSLLNQAITGAEPNARLRQKRWYANGALATYEAEFRLGTWATERWLLALGDYRSVTFAGQQFLLPHRIEASRDNFRVHLRISRWRPEASLPRTQ